MAFKDLLDKGKAAANKGLSSLKQGVGDIKENMAKQKASEAPVEGAYRRYSVMYHGGLIAFPKDVYGIGLNIMPDMFFLKPTETSKFEPLEIPYSCVEKLEIVKRTITNADMWLSSSRSDMKSMEQENNIEITYRIDGHQTLLRLEMITGTSIYGQAGKCREMMDVLRQYEILDKFSGETPKAAPTAAPAADPYAELKKAKELLDMGILTQEEFDSKKKSLLNL